MRETQAAVKAVHAGVPRLPAHARERPEGEDAERGAVAHEAVDGGEPGGQRWIDTAVFGGRADGVVDDEEGCVGAPSAQHETKERLVTRERPRRTSGAERA